MTTNTINQDLNNAIQKNIDVAREMGKLEAYNYMMSIILSCTYYEQVKKEAVAHMDKFLSGRK